MESQHELGIFFTQSAPINVRAEFELLIFYHRTFRAFKTLKLNLSFFFTALLRYNVHTIHLKCTIKCLFVMFPVLCSRQHNLSEYSHHPTKRPCAHGLQVLERVWKVSRPPSFPSSKKPPLYFLLL